jgi:hypothetical protein
MNINYGTNQFNPLVFLVSMGLSTKQLRFLLQGIWLIGTDWGNTTGFV